MNFACIIGAGVHYDDMNRKLLGPLVASALSLFFVFPATAQTPPTSALPAAMPTAAPSVQELFNQAGDLMIVQDWRKSLEILNQLEARLAKGKSERSKAIVAVRKATVLARLGEYEAAGPLIEAALPNLPVTDETLFEDIHRGYMTMGTLAERRFDYPGARQWFRRSFDFAKDPVAKSQSSVGLVTTGIFVDPQQALADADAALMVVKAAEKPNAEWLGWLTNLRGRVLLNLGRLPEARQSFDEAIKHLGGLRYGKVNVLDTGARSDAAIAALRAGDAEAARRYLAYSGAVMQASQGFSLGKDMRPPACGGDRGPQPDDVAVVELSIRENGTVGLVRPIYFSGEPSVGIEFARAVSEWSWSPEELKEVKPFFRVQTRLEMRCTTVFNQPDTREMLMPQLSAWLAEHGIADLGPRAASAAREAELLQAELKRREALDPNSLQLLPILIRLTNNAIIPFDQSAKYSARALAMATAASPSPSALAYFELGDAFMVSDRYGVVSRAKLRHRLSALLAQPQIAADASARAVVSLSLYDSLERGARRQNGRVLLTGLAEDAERAANDPFRIAALIRLANLEHDDGKVDDARALFAKSGLSAQQCALVDAKPRQTSGSISDASYPQAALAWGFAGWTVIEFDIAANGTTANQRPLISFPPFVFSEPTAKQIKSFRYEQSYRPEGGLGCGGQQQRVTYRTGL